MSDFKSIERTGINKCAYIFEKSNFIFREQTVSDYGIDALIETRENDTPSGKMIAVQIKSGDSYFKESDGSHVLFRISKRHRDYWINHSLPVIIVLYSPTSDKCIWEYVNKQTLVFCENQWKIRIPESKTIENNLSDLYEIAKNISEYEHRHASLVFAKDWMLETRKQGSLVLEVEEWINKTSGRGTFILKSFDEARNEKILFEREILGFGNKNYSQVIKELFPWADIEVDKDYYDNHFEMYNEGYESYSPSSRLVDNKIYPYHNAAGEVDFYRLLLTLNQIGNAFLMIENFLENENFYCIDHFEN